MIIADDLPYKDNFNSGYLIKEDYKWRRKKFILFYLVRQELQ